MTETRLTAEDRARLLRMDDSAISAWFRRRRVQKCQQKGHRERRIFHRGHVLPSHPAAAGWFGHRHVAFDVGRITTVCGRCGAVLDQKIENYGALHGYSMPSDLARRLERDKEVWFE